jgi:uncharacterized peroxidase-related enzyme
MPFLKSLPENAGPPAVFKKFPRIFDAWSEASQAMMNDPSPLSEGERELILAFAAQVAGCDFVGGAHAEVAYVWGIEQGLVDHLVADFDSAPVDAKLRPLLAFVRKLALTPGEMAQADADAVLAAGWDEEALQSAIIVTARAAFMQRLAEGHGFTPLSREAAIKSARARVKHGYVNLYKIAKTTEE